MPNLYADQCSSEKSALRLQHQCAYESEPVPCYSKAVFAGILSARKMPGSMDCASIAILPIRHSNSLTVLVSIAQPSAGSAYWALLSMPCNASRTILQTLPMVSTMQASAMDR